MLAADAFGVPAADRETDTGAGDVFTPVRLHCKGAGNRSGLGNEPQPEFSTCFGGLAVPALDPSVYGNCCAS